MICPFCGTDSILRTCSGCGRSLEGIYALRKASGQYYDEGLRYAREHRLAHARHSLEKAIRYNAENINARNLLGVVYCETGEIGEAIRQWNISLRIEKTESLNIAGEYLKKASRTMGRAAAMKEAVRLYNQALLLLEKGQMDTALSHLKKAVAQSEHYVRARELLALCCLKEHQWNRAAELLAAVEKIDAEDEDLPHLKKLCVSAREEWEASREARELRAKRRREGLEEDEGVDETISSSRIEVETETSDASSASPVPGLPSYMQPHRETSLRAFFRKNSVAAQAVLFFAGLAIGILFMWIFF